MSVPKPIFLNADLSQVEARVELLLAASTPEFEGTQIAAECVRLATAHPADFDIHTWSAGVCFGKSESEVKDTEDEPERYLGKRSMHGYMRGMGAARLSDLLLVDGYVVTPEECARRLGKLAARLPAIQDGFFLDVRRQLMRYRGLGTTWGAIWRCDDARLDDQLYGDGYSYQPVRETVDLINQCGLFPMANAIAQRSIPFHAVPVIHVHGHDSLLMSIDPRDAYACMAFFEHTLASHTRTYRASALQVPVGYGLGENWKTRFEFKLLPDEKTVLDAAMTCSEAAI